MSGDATLISATDLRVAFNERVILDGASLSILDGDRVGLVGRNGSGKSTFIRILAELATPDSGTVSRRKDLVVGYLSQDFTLDASKNVYENVKSGAQEVLDLIDEFERLPADSHLHSELEERIRILEGWDLEHRISTAMSQLHCPAGDRSIDALSGGEKRRVALCRAIISRPDLLILDEPTNHLDNESIEWLADYLEHYPSAFLLVTHDRYFLERCINRMVELADGTFWSHSGTYADYLEAKASRQATAELVEHKRQVALKREWEWYRTGPRAQRTKSKIRMAAHERAVEEKAPEFEKDVDLVIPPPPPLGNRVAELANVGMEFGGRRLFSGVSLKFAGGQRIGITGRNGLGKTTLLKILLGELKPTEGEARVGPLTRFNYVDQARLALDPEATVLDAVGDGTEFVVFGEGRLSLRAYLKRFLFNDDRLVARVKHLSGGERSRLLLARILKRGGNFLILDEPTNDLDLPTLRVLEEALLQFPGVVLMVSHDRYFLNRVSTDILAFEGGGRVVFSSGDYDYYLEKRQRQEAPVRAAAPAPVTKAAKPVATKPRKLTFKEQKELEGMEAAIQVAETRTTELEERFADPDFHRKFGAQTADLTRELEAARTETTRLFARWEELESIRQASA